MQGIEHNVSGADGTQKRRVMRAPKKGPGLSSEEGETCRCMDYAGTHTQKKSLYCYRYTRHRDYRVINEASKKWIRDVPILISNCFQMGESDGK